MSVRRKELQIVVQLTGRSWTWAIGALQAYCDALREDHRNERSEAAQTAIASLISEVESIAQSIKQSDRPWWHDRERLSSHWIGVALTRYQWHHFLDILEMYRCFRQDSHVSKEIQTIRLGVLKSLDIASGNDPNIRVD
jgi:hypothetical protein